MRTDSLFATDPLVQNGTWIGGSSTYSDLQEALVYFFNAGVPAAAVSDDTELAAWTKTIVDYTIAHQDSDGWFGPNPRYQWARWLYLLGAMQYLELNQNDPEIANPLLDSIYKFVDLSSAMLNTTTYDAGNGGTTGVESWGAVRPNEYIHTLLGLYDNFPRDESTQQLLLATARRVKEVGDLTVTPTWEEFFQPGTFNTDGYGAITQRSHGVNLALALKLPSLQYRLMGGDQAEAQRNADWYSILYQYHMSPAGHFQADEHLAGLEPHRGAETCQMVEDIVSGATSYSILGRNEEADRVEAVAYNSLPGAMTGSTWQHQYLQQLNQIYVGNMNQNPFRSDGAYSNVQGLEPNYPCCTVNHPAGFAKFITHSWMKTWDKSTLVHALLGPSKVTTQMNGGTTNIEVDTNYPFDTELDYSITSDAAFQLALRVPGWATGASYSINGGVAVPIVPDANNQQVISVPAGSTSITFTVPQSTNVTTNADNTVYIHRGPLHYVTDVGVGSTVINTWAEYNLPHVQDLQFNPTTSWNYAIEPATLEFHDKGVARGDLPSPVFDAGQSPYSFTVSACLVDWPTTNDQYVQTTPNLPTCQNEDRVQLNLVPYAAAKLRVGQLPVFAV